MKRVLLAVTALVFAIAIKAQSGIDDIIKMNTEKHDFGKIVNGKPVDFYFEITNKSNKPIVVESTVASCGCTTPEKPTEPIAPGATGKIKVQYNASAMGHFNKQVTIKLAGVDTPKIVSITGDVLSQADYDVYVKEQADKNKTKSKSKSGK